MQLLESLILLSSVLASRQQPPPPVENVVCQPGYAPSQLEISYPAPPCEPCIEDGVLYPGNNINLVPDYGVKDFQQCRSMCREEIRCHYFTFDKENSWCYLKTSKRPRGVKEGRGKQRYVSGSENSLCQSDDENEVEVDKKVLDQEISDDNGGNYKEENGSKGEESVDLLTPILSVYHENGYRTVLTAIPATFGLTIKNDTEVSGHLVQIEDFMCNLPNNHFEHGATSGNMFAVVRRGVCKFSTKVETAVKAGFEGVVILDDQNNTDVKRISGVKTSLTENVPVVFLLRKEAAILKRLLAESQNITATIQESKSFSWFKRKSTTTTTSEPLSPLHKLDQKKFLMGMRDPSYWWPPRKRDKHFLSRLRPQPSQQIVPTTTTTATTTVDVSTLKSSPRGMVEMTPLTMGSIIVGLLFFVLLLTSLGTLIVSKYTKRVRRRANHTRCQEAIRQMEANGSLSQDNSGFSPDVTSATAPPPRALPKSTYSLLECPVCLELAWPPKRIYQCREGHIVCDVCKANPNLRNCPMCRIPFATNFTSRNRQLEELARTLKEEDQLEKMNGYPGDTQPSAPEYSDIPAEGGDTSELLDPLSRTQIVITQAFISPELSPAPVLTQIEVELSQEPPGPPMVNQSPGPLVGTQSPGPLVVNLPPESS